MAVSVQRVELHAEWDVKVTFQEKDIPCRRAVFSFRQSRTSCIACVAHCDRRATAAAALLDCQARPRSMAAQLLSFLKWSWEWDSLNLHELIAFIFRIEYPRVYAARSKVGDLVREDLAALTYFPTPLLGPVLQSALSMTLRDWMVQPSYHRTVVRLEDNGTIGLDWFRWAKFRSDVEQEEVALTTWKWGRPDGSPAHSRISCVKSLCAAAMDQGWRPVAMVYRGCGGLPLETPRPYSALDTADLHAAVCHVQRLYPAAPLLLAGFSMGAMLVTKYLSEIETGVHRLDVRPVAAVAGSSPFDLGAAWRRLSSSVLSLGFFLQYVVALRWVHYAWKHRRQLGQIKGFRPDAMWRCTSMIDVDAQLICKALGFRSVEQYYRKISSAQYIPDIRTPCLFPIAADDPFCPKDLPVMECRASPETALLVTKRGGHIAHLQGIWPLGRSYLDDVATGFFKLMLQQ